MIEGCKQARGIVFFSVLFLLLTGCMSGGEDILNVPDASQGEGPRVIFDPLAHPDPRIPLPNNIATVMDKDSPTGRRLNLRITATTQFERGNRLEINRLDGFGSFAPITVAFSEPLDLNTLNPDSVKLINVDPSSPRYGEEIPLDLPRDHSRSLYPVEISPWPFPPHSPSAYARQMMFNPEYQGDVGTAKYVDFYERETDTLILRVVRPMDQQTEYMVVLTKDLLGVDGHPVRSAFTKPVHAQQVNSYKRAVGLLNGKGVSEGRIAFAWSFTTQTLTRELEVISQGLHAQGPMNYLPDLYPPVFTSVANLETQLDQLFCQPDSDNPCRDNLWILQAELLQPFMGIASAPGLVRAIGILFIDADLGETSTMTVDLGEIDYFAFGRILAPDFRQRVSETFHMDYRTGKAEISEVEVPFMIAIPKPSPDHQPPFPVVLLTHGVPALRWQLVTEANAWAKKGFATAVLSAPQHSPILSIQDIKIVLDSIIQGAEQGLCEQLPEGERQACVQNWDKIIHGLLDGVGEPVVSLLNCLLFGNCEDTDGSFDDALEAMLQSGFLAQLLVEGRAEDVDGDGNTDHGAIFTADLFTTRDRIRQHMVEQMQFLQLFKNLSQENLEAQGLHGLDNPSQVTDEAVIMPYLLAGDFNADGILDFGGKDAYGFYEAGAKPAEVKGLQRYFRSGLSFGGIAGSILMAIEPDVRTAALSVPGGGLTDVMSRCDLHPVIDRVQHELQGPILVGEPVVKAQDGGASETSFKVSFIRRGKKELLNGRQGEESLWDVNFPDRIQEMQVPVNGLLEVVNLDNGERISISQDELWGEDAWCIGKSILDAGADLSGKKGCFSKGIASDKGDRILITAMGPKGKVVDQIEAAAPDRGMGKGRNTPSYRFFTHLGQTALDAGDPINYAPHWFLDPLEGADNENLPEKNLLVIAVPGDMFVPINTQIALARAGGLLGSESNQCDGLPQDLSECGQGWDEISKDCDYINLYWKENDVMIGYHDHEKPRFDVDGLLKEASGECHPRTLPLIDNRDKGAGYSYIRFPYSHVWCTYGYVEPANRGMHWLMASFSNPELPVDWSTYYQSQMAEYFDTEGYRDEPMMDPDCPCPVSADSCDYLK